jgi:hypothetical protein
MLFLEILASLLTLSGAWLTGSRSMFARKLGFSALLLSSLLWMIWASSVPFFLMQIGFCATSVWGLCNNWKWRKHDD